jgi:hypothetical protein
MNANGQKNPTIYRESLRDFRDKVFTVLWYLKRQPSYDQKEDLVEIANKQINLVSPDPRQLSTKLENLADNEMLIALQKQLE